MSNTLVFDIKRYAINDGPGIRMTIFLKGCPLSCDWCHNPESQSSKVQKLYSKSKCITCGECVEACPTNAISLTDNGIITDFSLCETCGKCADVCPTKATEMSGEYKTVEELMLEVDKQKVFFQQSGGGVTISGGEPLMHSEFLNELLDALKENKIHTVIDTTGFSKPSILKNIAAKTDLFLYDLKMIDSVKHKKYTGVDNKIILENLILLSSIGANIQIRIPLIKGVNDDEENMNETANFISNLSGEKKKISILPYHNIASVKYNKLGSYYNEKGMSTPPENSIEKFISILNKRELNATIGG